MVANLNRQVSEQTRDIEMLNKRIESLQKQLETRSREKEPVLPKLVIESPVQDEEEVVSQEVQEEVERIDSIQNDVEELKQKIQKKYV